MSKTLTEIAQQLQDTDKKVQLIYAFNGVGKTRLSRELKDLIAPESENNADEEDLQPKVLYYNAFTEDLFYWGNGSGMKIQPNAFTDWIIGERGAEPNIVKNFQSYVNDKLTPTFKEEDIIKEGKKTGKKNYPEVFFSLDTGTERTGSIKISKGEESNFIWSIFYTLLQEAISILDEPDPEKRDDNQFDQLEYVFIDDPVTSLDENHLIELAVDLAMLVKSSSYTNGKGVRFIITTHNPLFYNVLCNEFNNDLERKTDVSKGKYLYKRRQYKKYILEKKADSTFELEDSNDHPFSYHLFLLLELKSAINNNQIRKYHFSFLRNILEKTSTFLGYKRWQDLLEKTPEGNPDPFANRILNLSSHSAHAGEEVAILEENDKEKLGELVNFLINKYCFCQQD